MRGFEPLGRGLVAIWQIESSIAADSGGGVLAGRETYVGLDGDWGTVKLGNFLAPYDDMHAIFGNVPTLTTSILSTAALWAQGSLSKAAGGFDARLSNSVRYDLPEWRGLEGSVQYSLGEDSRHSHVLGLTAIYTHEAFEGGIAYERNYQVRGPELNDWGLTVAAGWNFGPMRIAGVYERLRYATPVGPLTRNFYGASAIVLAGPGSLLCVLGTRGGGQGERRRTGRRARERRRNAGRPVRAELHVSAVAAHAALRGLRAPRQRLARELQLRDQSLYRRVADRARAQRVRARRRAFLLMLDALIIGFDRTLRTFANVASSARPVPGSSVPEPELSRDERRHAAGLMRVNHTGEVCAQALYAAQALVARDPALRAQFAQAAREEEEHLAWTPSRLAELGDRPSLLNPLWYAGSFAIGLAAGVAGDRANLSFVVETERQVEEHLTGHVERLPAQDAKSRAIVEQMRDDEARHGAMARGGRRLATALPGRAPRCASRPT